MVNIVETTYIEDSYHDNKLYILVCIVFSPGQLLPCPKEAVADPLSKYLLKCSPVQYYQVLEGSYR